jgi:nucleotide-binding universal stress UspA family protein
MRGEHAVAFNRILVPLDGSELAEQAIPFARAVARDEGTLIYAQIVPRAEAIHGLTGGTVASASEVGAMFEQTATGDLEAAAQRWKEIAPHYETVIGVGDPAETILELARQQNCDLIVIASHGRGALGRWTFGSVADRLTRTSDLPVLIIRPQDASVEYGVIPTFGRILLPTDGSALSQSAVDEAAALGKQLGQEVVLVRSIFPEAELAPTAGFDAVYAPEIYEELSRSLEADARKSLDATAQMVRDEGAEVGILLMHGPAAQTIESVARPDDLIVMTSHGRSGFRRWLIGSVAEKLVRTAPCPVMLVRAEQTAEATK